MQKAMSLFLGTKERFFETKVIRTYEKKSGRKLFALMRNSIYFREKSRDVYKTRYRRTSSISAEIVNYSWETVGKWLEMGRRLSCGYEIEFLRSFKGF